MRSFLGVVSFVVALLFVGGTALAIWSVNTYRAPGTHTEDVTFVVARGQGVAQVAENLRLQGLITQPLLLRAAARVKGIDKGIHAGEYLIPAYASMDAILEKMAWGDVVKRQITVREGLTSWQVVQLLNNAQGMEGDITDIPAEGLLLPETYSYVLGDKRTTMVERMKEGMIQTINELWETKQEGLPFLTKAEAITLASIVEKETGVPDERNRVAGVFVNRLRKGMPLQSDPTVIYAMTGGRVQDDGRGPIGRRLLRGDMQFESPYNTYKNPGLPPGPIANPGRDSIAAVLQPEAHDYYYFVADGTGGHIFSRTLDEHNANVQKWREIRKLSGE